MKAPKTFSLKHEFPKHRFYAPSLFHIKETIIIKGNESLPTVAKIANIGETAFYSFIKHTYCSYTVFEKLVAYCKEIAPEEDWYYIPREELVEALREFRKAGGRVEHSCGISKSRLKNYSVGYYLPNITAYYKLINYLGGKIQCSE